MDLPAMIESVAPHQTIEDSSNVKETAKTSSTSSTSTKECNLDLSKYQSLDPGDSKNNAELIQNNPIFEKSDITVTKTIETKVNIVTLIGKAENETQKTISPKEEEKIEITTATVAITAPKVEEPSVTSSKKGKKKNKKNKNVTPPPEAEETTTTKPETAQLEKSKETIEDGKSDDAQEIKINVEPSVPPSSLNMSPLISTLVEESTVTTRIETNNQSTINDEVIVITNNTVINNQAESFLDEANTTLKSESVELDVKTQIPIELSSDVKVAVAAATSPVFEANKNIEIIEFNKSKPDVAPPKILEPKILEQKPIVLDTIKKSEDKKSKLKKDKATPKQEKQQENKTVKKSNTSCFACKSKKSKKEEKPKLEIQKEASIAKESNVTILEASKVNLVNISEDSSQKASFKLPSQNLMDKSYFHGLDPMPNASSVDKTIDIPSICSVETQKPLLKQANSEMGDATSIAFCKESVEQTPSMIGSTSIEIPNISQNEVHTQVIVEQTTTTEKHESQTNDFKLTTSSTEQELPTISVEVDKNLPNLEFNKIEETLKVEQQPKKLSDDIVVLPDPKLHVQIPNLVLNVDQKKDETEKNIISMAKKDDPKEKKGQKAKKDTTKTKTDKDNKSSNVSCFSCKKDKSKEKKIDTTPKEAPINKPTANVSVNIDSPLVLPEIQINKTPENWAIGLDRKEDEAILNLEPVKLNVEPKPAPQASVTTDIPADSIEVVKPQEVEIKDTEVKLNSIKNEIDLKLTTKSDGVDLSGAHIVIDRRPDHATIPIVQSEFIPKIPVNVNVDTTTTNKPEGDKKKAKDKSSKKTGILDLPLIKVLGPKKKQEVKDEKKAQETVQKPSKEAGKNQVTKEIIDINKDIKLDAPLISAELPELKIEALTINQSEQIAESPQPLEPPQDDIDANQKLKMEYTVETELKSETKKTFESNYIKGDIEVILNKIETSETELKKEFQQKLDTQKSQTEFDKEALVEASNKNIETVFSMIEGETSNKNIDFEFKKVKSEIVTESEINKFTQVLNELNMGSAEKREKILHVATPDLAIPETPKKIKSETNIKEETIVRIPDVVVLPTKEEPKAQEIVEPSTNVKLTEINLQNEAKENAPITNTDSKNKKEQAKEKKPKEAKKPKEDKKKKEKSKKNTSCMDMPIIDILIPKSVKTTKKETDIVKKDKDNANAEDKAVDNAKSLTEASPLQVKIDHGDLFKGLDPESITKTDKYPTSSPTQQVTVKVEDIKNEESVKHETTTIALKETIKLKEETKKVEVEKPTKVKAEKEIQIATIDIPTVIDVPQIKLDDKKPKAKVESWTTDPLPHVVIGLHKLGSTEEPREISAPVSIVQTQQAVEIKSPAVSTEKTKPEKLKTKKKQENKASCFSCKSKKAKTEIQKVEDIKITGTKVQKDLLAEKVDDSSKITAHIDLTSKLVNLDAPYNESPKKTEITIDSVESTIEKIKVPEPQIVVEVHSLQQAQAETSTLTQIVKEAVDANDKNVDTELRNISDSIIDKIETAAIAEAINDEEVKPSIKIEVPNIPLVKVEEKIEFTTPTVDITLKSPEKTIASQEKSEKTKIEKPKKEMKEKPKKVTAEQPKEEIKKDKKSDPFLVRSSVSCFSCRSKKSKNENKQNTDKTDAESSIKTLEKEKIDQKSNLDETASKVQNPKLSPEIHKDTASSDLFKGLDKPSVSECLHISDHQSFLDFKIEEPKIESPSIELKVEDKSRELTLSESIEKTEESVTHLVEHTIKETIVSETVEKLSSISNENKLEINVTAQDIATTKIQKNNEKIQELTQKVIMIPNLVITAENQDQPKKLSDDIVVLPDPSLRIIEIPKTEQINKEKNDNLPIELEDKDSHKAKKKDSSSNSCFKCKSNKKVESKKKTNKDVEKKIKKAEEKVKEIDVSPTAVPWVYLAYNFLFYIN
jgi:hypothetical protein